MLAFAIALIWLGVWCVCSVWCAGGAARREPAAAQRSCVPYSMCLFMRERGQVNLIDVHTRARGRDRTHMR